MNKIRASHCSCDVQKSDVRFVCPIRALQSYNGALLEYRMPICVPGGLKLPFNSDEDRSEAASGGLKLPLNSDEDRSEAVPGGLKLHLNSDEDRSEAV
ncbi:hypothetical protein AVEN_154154-1 [Araneus ventricosus]|uniref:Uncharacterized protein n=1 Tax=Araneus ventricosus TaxID=182803 RepID=A0A4Y2SJE1_ARAVE|nr:hypothetical protein AVEN_154154-1 [Araneus ventricosus]